MSITPLGTSTQAGATAQGQASTATSASSTSAASATSQANPALSKANARVQAQIDATGAQLSSMGKLKSALSELQTGARALSASASTTSTTVADAKAAVGRWVSAFNASLAAAKSAATALAGGDPSGAKRAGNDLSRSVTANAGTLDALRKMGVKLQADGTLAADPARLDAAWSGDASGVKAAMGKIGTALDQVATKELASTGNVALSMASLNKKSNQLSTQSKAIESFVEGSGSTSTTASGASATSGNYTSSTYASYALNAYKNSV